MARTAAACAMMCVAGARGFVLPGSYASSQQGQSLPAGLVSRIAAEAAPQSPIQASSASSNGLMLAGAAAVFAGALAFRQQSRRQRTVARRLTMKEIEIIDTDTVPKHWKMNLTYQNAIAIREASVLRATFFDSFFVIFLSAQGLTQLQRVMLEQALPEQWVRMAPIKRKVITDAVRGTKWKSCAKAVEDSPDDLLVICGQEEDLIRPVMEAIIAWAKKLKRDKLFDERRKMAEPDSPDEFATMVLGSVLRDETGQLQEYDFLDEPSTMKLETMPTKLELIARIAGSIQQVTKKIAVGVKQLPQKTAVGFKKIVEKMEEQGRAKVGDIVA